jgi:hypothetical protein
MQDMKNNHDTTSLNAFRNEVNNYSPLSNGQYFSENALQKHIYSYMIVDK